ncbi:MAG: tRNA lysidine(34) synthetase TilS [Candidatus Zixiibacteriota bacterium]
MLSKVNDAVVERKLIAPGDSVLVALSGGPDSVALLHVLSRLQPKMKLQLHAVYINHQIRKRAARHEEQFCQTLCDRLKVPLTIIREDIPARAHREKKGLEETARDFRYATFKRLADELACTKVALGHHLDDRVETILLRVLRGTGRTGLLGVPIKRGIYIRPLFDVTKVEILAYLKRHRLDYCTDRSNETSEFSRNFVRNRLLPMLRKRLNPAVDRALVNLSETLDEEESFLQSITERAFKETVSATPGGKLALDLSILGGYPLWLRRRLLRRCVQTLSADRQSPDRIVIDRLEKLSRSEKAKLALPGRLEAAADGGKLLVYKRIKVSFQLPLPIGGRCIVPPLHLRIGARVRRKPSAVPRQRGARAVVIDALAVKPPLVVRAVKPGDRFSPLGLAGSKKVGDYLTDRKVPTVLRDEIPVVCDTDGIIWLVGYEIADCVKVTDSTEKVLKLESVRIKTGPTDEAD